MSADYIERTPIAYRTQALLAIDPGLNGTGWALWRSCQKDQPRTVAPDEVGVLRKRHANFVLTADWIADELNGFARTKRRWGCATHYSQTCGCGAQPSLVVVCEFPEFQTSASRSMGWMRGDLQKLTYLVGVLARALAPCSFEPVPVSQWKGQLPKDVVTRRIQEKLGRRACDDLGIKTHAWDAVGIGLWRLGVFE